MCAPYLRELDLIELGCFQTSARTNMPAGTVALDCVLCTPPEKFYRAFLNAQAMAKSLPPHGFTCTVEQLDAQVGGQFKMAFQNFSKGSGHTFGSTYVELVPE